MAKRHGGRRFTVYMTRAGAAGECQIFWPLLPLCDMTCCHCLSQAATAPASYGLCILPTLQPARRPGGVGDGR